MSKPQPMDTGLFLRLSAVTGAMITLLIVTACNPFQTTLKEEPVVVDSRIPELGPKPVPIIRCRVQPRTPCLMD